MTTVIDWAPCVGLMLLCGFCVWMAERADRANERAVVAYAENLCRAAAADPYQLNTEED